MQIISKERLSDGCLNVFKKTDDFYFGFFCQQYYDEYAPPVAIGYDGLYFLIDIFSLKLELPVPDYLDFLANFDTPSEYCNSKGLMIDSIIDKWITTDEFLDTLNDLGRDGIKVNLELEDLEGFRVLKVK